MKKEEPIRILQCMPTNLVCGGIENFIMNIYRNIDRNKIQFDFLTHGIGEDYFEEEIKQLGGKLYRVPFIKDYENYKKQMDKFWQENQERYQTIHIHACYAMSYFDAKQAKKHKIKNIIVHSHSASTNVKKRKMVQNMLKNRLTKIANYRLTCSKEAAKWMFSKKVVENQQYKKINNAIHVEDFQFNSNIREKVRKELGIEEKFVVGHVGRLSAAKNHMFLLEIFEKILKKQENAVLLLVGDGELKDAIKEKAEKLGVLEKVIFLGNNDKVTNFLQAMDTFVFPSLFEGFGLAVLEAQITGLPCFIADHITKEVKVADLVEFISLQEKPEQWAEKILAKKIDKREDKVGLVKEKKYDIIDVTKELEDFYLAIN